jgi:SOS-response transcriptional repressor LexA
MKFKSVEQALEVLVTEKQRTIFLCIDEYWKRQGYGPSIDDVMMLTGDKSRSNVSRVMHKLCDLGVCKMRPNSARSIRPAHIKLRNLP